MHHASEAVHWWQWLPTAASEAVAIAQMGSEGNVATDLSHLSRSGGVRNTGVNSAPLEASGVAVSGCSSAIPPPNPMHEPSTFSPTRGGGGSSTSPLPTAPSLVSLPHAPHAALTRN
jgi:hypothetical protein